MINDKLTKELQEQITDNKNAILELIQNKPKIVNLWSGQKNTTGNITLDDDYDKYDIIGFTIAPNNTNNYYSTSILSNDIIIDGELTIGVFQKMNSGNPVSVSLVGRFTNKNTFNINSINCHTWNTCYLKRVFGIKL